ncbi:hypothetical protein ATY81_08170 [Rhizobium sp. R72]|nr:hypothetical protein ATY81_08170 [Rhizobium sp. R72]OWV97740.1 hypothetical protein ATY80_08170 [Rhizobium sp. R711]
MRRHIEIDRLAGSRHDDRGIGQVWSTVALLISERADRSLRAGRRHATDDARQLADRGNRDGGRARCGLSCSCLHLSALTPERASRAGERMRVVERKG